jgi:transcriptional regulator with GAF, ATPase, and Fis domain
LSSQERLRRERDLCLRLLGLGDETDKDQFLRSALDLIVETTEAEQGYIELQADETIGKEATWSLATGFSEKEIHSLRYPVSTSIITETLKSREVVVTPSAQHDPRFEDEASVRDGQIEAVLCVPIGKGPPGGVLYLHGRRSPGAFTEEDTKLALLFARHVAPLAAGLLARHRNRFKDDPTLEYRRRLSVDALVGSSRALAQLLKQVSLVAPLDVGVLLTGDSGTGKSLVASIIHANGPRAAEPFVEVNCAGIPDNLIESELFGHERGSFTGATERRRGRFELAGRGTIFLDEIAELSRAAQGKLLRVLQEGRFERVGGTATIESSARVIAATNADLEKHLASGRFREDLFYRLNVLPIHVPSLAERRSDLVSLARCFAERARERHRLPEILLSEEAEIAIQTTEWPGNVRQLENAVEAAVIRAAGDDSSAVETAHLFPGEERTVEASTLTLQQATRRFQRDFLQRALTEANGNVAETARRLGIARTHVYNLIKSLGIERLD